MRRMTVHDSAEANDLAGKLAIVTGANSGIGKETAVALAARGARVVMLCRSEQRGNDALVEVRKRSGGRVDLILADLGEPDSVRNFVDEYAAEHDQLDILVNNAGVYLEEQRRNSRGWEMHWAVNHLGPALLTQLLTPQLAASDDPRVVNVSSMGHRIGVLNFDDPFCERRSFVPLRMYCDTKLANVVWTQVSNEDLARHGIRSFSLHPGMIATNLTAANRGPFAIVGRLSRPVLLDAARGAATQIWLATAAEVPASKGSYYAGSRPRTPSRAARSPTNISALRDWTKRQLET